MSKHTPGPWDRGFSSGTAHYVAAAGRVATGIPSEADARLIAAAPEMLEALHEAVDMIASEYCSHTLQTACGPNNSRCYAQKFYAVIAKAEGK